ncbi:MAG: hypothetical protein FD123_1836 [Bacteroidetes bacterium]|nr:MAG: hypothetical protein FD123_1836 [Bacteroidota bacterium]
MNLREAILKEHSKANRQRIVKWIGKDPQRFKELVGHFLGNEYRLVQLAAPVLSDCAEAQPQLVKPYLGKLIKNLEKEGHHDAVVRGTVRFLQFTDVPEKYLGILANTCFRLLMKADSPIAVKAFSMTVLLNICRKEPGLKNELKLVIEGLMSNASAGLCNRGQKTLRALEKI